MSNVRSASVHHLMIADGYKLIVSARSARDRMFRDIRNAPDACGSTDPNFIPCSLPYGHDGLHAYNRFDLAQEGCEECNKIKCICRGDEGPRFYYEDEVDCNEDEVEEESE